MTAGYNGDGLRGPETDAWAGSRDYTWGPGGVLYDRFQTTIRTPGVSQRRNATDRYYWSDSRGSTRHLTSTGNAITQSRWYDSFGNQANTTGTDGRVTDSLFAGAWGYQTEYNWGTDPIGWAGGLNLFDYCNGDPVNLVDPTGLGRVLPSDPRFPDCWSRGASSRGSRRTPAETPITRM